MVPGIEGSFCDNPDHMIWRSLKLVCVRSPRMLAVSRAYRPECTRLPCHDSLLLLSACESALGVVRCLITVARRVTKTTTEAVVYLGPHNEENEED